MGFEIHQVCVTASNVRACAKSGTPRADCRRERPVMCQLRRGNHEADINDTRREADVDDPNDQE